MLFVHHRSPHTPFCSKIKKKKKLSVTLTLLPIMFKVAFVNELVNLILTVSNDQIFLD